MQPTRIVTLSPSKFVTADSGLEPDRAMLRRSDVIENEVMPTAAFTSEINELLLHFRQLADTSSSLMLLQEGMVKAIAERLPLYNWTGFYMLDPEDAETLVLGPYVGAPTPHIRIPVTEGICGAAVATGESVIVDDVGADPRYLSCSIDTKSEIVVPIYARGVVIGELDIDSHTPAAFTQADQEFLERAARIVGEFVETHPDS